jgi:uncharacterized membrane protein YdbT with pleckstrin-like domain
LEVIRGSSALGLWFSLFRFHYCGIGSSLLVRRRVWSYEAFRYQLTQYGFYKESGVLQKKPVVIPYGKIHKVEIYRGILEKMRGLSGLRVQIAGRYRVRRRRGLFGQEGVHSSSFKKLNTLAEEELYGLSVEVAEQLKTELLVRKQQAIDPESNNIFDKSVVS